MRNDGRTSSRATEFACLPIEIGLVLTMTIVGGLRTPTGPVIDAVLMVVVGPSPVCGEILRQTHPSGDAQSTDHPQSVEGYCQ